MLILVLLGLYLVIRGRPGWGGWAIILLALVGLLYHASKLLPYLGIGPQPAVGLASCREGTGLSVMVANVQKSNANADAFLAIAAEVEPDVLLVLETDERWDEQLAPLRALYPEIEQFIPEDRLAYGMHLFSKRRLVSPEMRFLFDSVTPTIVTGLELEDGSLIQFIGMHPQPPFFWSQPSTLRDAHLLSAALEAQASEVPTVVAGDLNAVPWERTTRRMIRIGGLLDPRMGRGFYPTVGAESLLVSWPLDHVLYQEEFGLLGFEVLPAFGSDHLPVLANLCLSSEAAELQEPPVIESGDLREAEASIEAARRLAEGD